jgi:hypothetical protein
MRYGSGREGPMDKDNSLTHVELRLAKGTKLSLSKIEYVLLDSGGKSLGTFVFGSTTLAPGDKPLVRTKHPTKNGTEAKTVEMSVLVENDKSASKEKVEAPDKKYLTKAVFEFGGVTNSGKKIWATSYVAK